MLHLSYVYQDSDLNRALYVSASTNLVGKFTQSVRRIVQDVKDEGTSSKFGNYILSYSSRVGVSLNFSH